MSEQILPTTGRAWHLDARPAGWPTPSEFALREVEIPAPGLGQILVVNEYLSVHPYMRGRMSDKKSFAEVKPGDTVFVSGAAGAVGSAGSDEKVKAAGRGVRLRRGVQLQERPGRRAARAGGAGGDRRVLRQRRRRTPRGGDRRSTSTRGSCCPGWSRSTTTRRWSDRASTTPSARGENVGKMVVRL